ncbi:hypothetical protein BdWA1_001764 [Babesia duncani]|uniref:Uncharacterized protein n=1 Tax=Babesia duncani TaxID=323732 RepID=A0AAD9PL83_9APIC|nr:hypothetical protein BdWA1_001764 [Babesia duncani]
MKNCKMRPLIGTFHPFRTALVAADANEAFVVAYGRLRWQECRNYTTRVVTVQNADSRLSAKRDTVDESAPDSNSIQEKQENAIVYRKPIPANFIRETFLPHLEHNVAYNVMKFPPAVVLEIGIAYSKLPAFIRQRAIEDALVESFSYRMVDYTASECVQLLNTTLQLQGIRTIKIYEEIIQRLKSHSVEPTITPLNRLGICRSVSRILQRAYTLQPPSDNDNNRNSGHPQVLVPDEMSLLDEYKASWLRPWSFIIQGIKSSRIAKFAQGLVDYASEFVLPQLEFELTRFDSQELCDLLTVIAQRSHRDNTASDFPLVAVLMSRIIKGYETTPLATNLANLCSLASLKMYHEDFCKRIIKDLQNPLKMNNIYHSHLARTVWAIARFGLLEPILGDLLQHIEYNIPRFDAAGFARLSQVSAHVDSREFVAQIYKILLCIHYKLSTLDAKQLAFFLNGCCFMNALPSALEFEKYINLCPGGYMQHDGPKSHGQPIPAKFNQRDKYLPKSAQSVTRTDVLVGILRRYEEIEADLDLVEINRLIKFLKSTHQYAYICNHLPQAWSQIIKDFKDPLQI